MIHYGDDLITDAFTEYAVSPEEGTFIECEDLTEARQIAANFGTQVLQQRWFTTGWEPVE